MFTYVFTLETQDIRETQDFKLCEDGFHILTVSCCPNTFTEKTELLTSVPWVAPVHLQPKFLLPPYVDID